MRNPRFYAVLLAAIIIILSSLPGVAAAEYPFSDVVPWDKKSKRQEYDQLLRAAGFSIDHSFFVSSGNSPRLAVKQRCVLVKKNREIFGYGIDFEAFSAPAGIVNKENDDKREFELRRVEVLYDMAGRYIFLVSYSVRLSPGEAFIAKFFMGKEVEVERGIFKIDRPLEEGYELDGASRSLAETLLRLPEACKP